MTIRVREKSGKKLEPTEKRRKKKNCDDDDDFDELARGLTQRNGTPGLEMTIVTTPTSNRTMAEHFRTRHDFRLRIFTVGRVADVYIFYEPGEPLLYRRVRLRVDEGESLGAAAEAVRGRPVFGPGSVLAPGTKARSSGEGRLTTPHRKLLRL